MYVQKGKKSYINYLNDFFFCSFLGREDNDSSEHSGSTLPHRRPSVLSSTANSRRPLVSAIIIKPKKRYTSKEDILEALKI